MEVVHSYRYCQVDPMSQNIRYSDVSVVIGSDLVPKDLKAYLYLLRP